MRVLRTKPRGETEDRRQKTEDRSVSSAGSKVSDATKSARF